MVVGELAAAACFGLINSVGHTGGFVGPYIVGYLNERTGSMLASFTFIGVCYLLAAITVPFVKIRGQIAAAEPVRQSEQRAIEHS
jgi:MFS transporter, ACS family, tartrate transporter